MARYWLFGMLLFVSPLTAQEETPPAYEQSFEAAEGIGDFRFTDPAAWELDRGSLWQVRGSEYAPAHRSPHNIALLATERFGSFVLEFDAMQTGREYAHRDLCVFFAFQDPEHYCYAHLSSEADPNAHNVFVVDGAPRTAITTRRNGGVDWGWNAWHRVRVEFDGAACTVRVLVDGEEAVASERLPDWGGGYIGFGSFDDEARFDNIRVWSAETERAATETFAPARPQSERAGVRLERVDDRVLVSIGEERFTEYVFDGVPRPFLAPVLGPGGVRLTRAYPMAEAPGEAHDHPHHTGLWWSHGDINGADVWHRGGSLRLSEGPRLSGTGIEAVYELERDGEPTGVSVRQVIRFEETLSGDRIIDFAVELTPAPGQPLVFGDTKEGTMAIRTHPALRLKPDPGAGVAEVSGHAVNSEGVTGPDVWGKRAAWVDYSGRIEGADVGVAIFDHPDNPRFPTWWHAREYGLVAANPFGTSAFEGGERGRGRLEIADGRTVRFRYRFLLHRFDEEGARIADAFAAWASNHVDTPALLGRLPGSAAVINDDGGWCWFEGPRAIVVDGVLVVGSVAAGVSSRERRGDIELTLVELASGKTRVVELHDRLELDDHDQPGLCDLGDGRVLALWSKHGPENRIYRAIVDIRSGAIERMEPIVPSVASRVTYSNVYRLPGEGGRVYNFFRGLDNSWKPSYIYSDDHGRSWVTGNVFIDVSSAERHRPYVVYASDGGSRVHMLYTEGHPRNFDNSVYHLVYSGGMLRRSDGSEITAVEDGLGSPELGTRVFAGSAERVAWVADLRLDAAARPVGVLSVQMDSQGLPPRRGGDDHRYLYAKWDGSSWEVHEMAHAGRRLYAGEDDYTGLAAIDPSDTGVVVISTDADPVTGEPLISEADGVRHYELFLGTTPDSGRSWSWRPLTVDSTRDNLRPVFAGGERRVLVWLRGEYRSYTDYDQDVMMLVDP